MIPNGELPLKAEALALDTLERIASLELSDYEIEYLIGALVALVPSSVATVIDDIEQRRMSEN